MTRSPRAPLTLPSPPGGGGGVRGAGQGAMIPVSGETLIRNGRESKILSVDPGDPSPLVVIHYGTMDE